MLLGLFAVFDEESNRVWTELTWSPDTKNCIYYGSSDGKHFGWRNGFFNLATLRPDGFAGYESIDNEDYAIVTTKPIVFRGKNLCISADLNYDWSSIKVNIRDEQGHKILVSKKIKQKQALTDCLVGWIENKDLQGKRVRLEFVLDGAKLMRTQGQRGGGIQ